MDKIIITAGCSLTADDTSLDNTHRINSKHKTYYSYSHHIQKLLGEDKQVYNIGRDGADNGTISRNIIQLLMELNEQGISYDDMLVVVQWSGVDRHSIYVDEDYISGNTLFYKKEYNGWSLSSLDAGKSHWNNYYSDTHTDEGALNDTIKNIKEAQKFLTLKNIEYKMFCGWNIFDNDLDLDKHIDTSNFWFYENKKGHYGVAAKWFEGSTKYGGLREWVRDNVDKKYWTRGTPEVEGQDQHPTNVAHKKFTNEVLTEILSLPKRCILTTGCSFTNFRTTWSDYLEVSTDTEVINVGYKGSSNDIILRGIITNVEKLLQQNRKVDVVLIQLTTMERKYMINSGNFEMSPPAQNFMKSTWSSWFMPMNEGFKNSQEFWKTYWENIHSDELHFFELLEKIFLVQTYLKSKNIKYRMFCGWDLFTDSKGKDIFSKDKPYENINNELLKDKFTYCKADTHNSEFGIKSYWDMIDWDKWWFFENEKIKYGGITEWSQYNLEKDKWYQDDLHPSFDAHKKFNEEVILNLI